MMGAEDNNELSTLNRNYGIAEDRANRLVMSEKKKWLAGTLVGLIQAPPNIMGPTINKLRNTAASLGIDLSEDVPELTAGNREFLFTKEVAWLLEMGPEDADGEVIADAVEQFGVEETPANRILEREFKDATRQVGKRARSFYHHHHHLLTPPLSIYIHIQVCVDLMGNMNRNDHLGAFKDLGRLVRIGRMIPLPLNFGEEAFLGMAVCADIRKLWSAYANLLGKGGAQAATSGGIDLSALTQGLPGNDLEGFKKGFDAESEIVMNLISGLEALPASQADIDLNIDYRGRKVREEKEEEKKEACSTSYH